MILGKKLHINVSLCKTFGGKKERNKQKTLIHHSGCTLLILNCSQSSVHAEHLRSIHTIYCRDGKTSISELFKCDYYYCYLNGNWRAICKLNFGLVLLLMVCLIK